jgi:hypothetical protein
MRKWKYSSMHSGLKIPDESEYSASHHTHTLHPSLPGIHRTVGWVGPTASRGGDKKNLFPHQALNPASPVTQFTLYTEDMPHVMTMVFIIIMYHCVITKFKKNILF